MFTQIYLNKVTDTSITTCQDSAKYLAESDITGFDEIPDSSAVSIIGSSGGSTWGSVRW